MIEDINFKDKSPIETINKIRSILKSINIEVKEFHREHLDGLHSVSITCENLGFGTNGKGITKEYALASGYAEFMERLQTKTLYRRKYRLGDGKFDFFPDEQDTTEVGYDEKLYNMLVVGDSSNTEKLKMLMEFDNLLAEYTKTRSVKFISYLGNDSFWIPNNILAFCYASNGMAAGNSFEEAAIQGISEIFERYVNWLVLDGKIDVFPVDLNSNIIDKYIIETINEINESTNYNLQFIDLSNTGYPVIGLKCFDIIKKEYIIKFASHFNINIAIQRTITELFQGVDGKNITNMIPSDSMVYAKEKRLNKRRIFIDGRGGYGLSFIQNTNCQASIGDIWFNDITDNRIGFDFYLSIIKQNDKSLYYRDYSYLDFNTYHFIVPGLSEVNLINDEGIKEVQLEMCFCKTIKNLGAASDEQLMDIYKYLDYTRAGSKDTIGSILNVPLKPKLPYYRVSSLQLRLMINIKFEEYDEALSVINKHIKLTQSNNLSNKEYYLCLRDMLTYLVQYKSEEDYKFVDFELCLSQFYSKTIVEKVIQLFKKQRDIFESMPTLTCPNCYECSYKEYCASMEIKKLDTKLNQKFINLESKNERIII